MDCCLRIGNLLNFLCRFTYGLIKWLLRLNKLCAGLDNLFIRNWRINTCINIYRAVENSKTVIFAEISDDIMPI